jgi:crotonobetainyl-CoA:carnitine CoA-transferase CaiB-like acyl-CoA transferase
MFVDSDHPVAGKVKLVGPAVKLSATPGSVRTPAPTLGQHTDVVLQDILDMDPAAIDALREAGAIGPKR